MPPKPRKPSLLVAILSALLTAGLLFFYFRYVLPLGDLTQAAPEPNALRTEFLQLAGTPRLSPRQQDLLESYTLLHGLTPILLRVSMGAYLLLTLLNALPCIRFLLAKLWKPCSQPPPPTT